MLVPYSLENNYELKREMRFLTKHLLFYLKFKNNPY